MKPLLVALVLPTLGGLAAAQSTDEDSLFGGDSIVQEEQTKGETDESDGDGGLISDVSEDPGTDAASALLGGVTVGGEFEFSVEGALEFGPEGEASFSSGTADLGTQLFIDARPQRDFRVFADGDLEYSTANGAGFALDELFADVTVYDTVFVRAGKQTVNWGVGYFYSPANLVNLERIDPENPDEELSGPAALRAQLPIGSDNVTGYVLTGDRGGDLDLSAAARYETLLSGLEVTTGGVAEASGAWAVMGTATGTVADVTVFAEAVLEGNTEKVFVFRDAAPLGLGATQLEDLFFSGTLGGRYTYRTDNERFSLTATAQYFFNGKGYEDPSVLTDNPEAVAGLVGSGALSPDNLQERGRHYLGVNLVSPDVYGSDVTPSALWLANLSDGSGFISAGVNVALNDFLTPRLGYGFRYGETGSEYSPAGEQHNLTVGLDVSGAF